MAANKFTLAPCVEGELWAIWEYIARHNPEAADRVVEAAFETFAALADTPAMGRDRRFRNPKLRGIRSWPVSRFNNYLIFYRITSHGIEVLHVYHGARNLEALFE